MDKLVINRSGNTIKVTFREYKSNFYISYVIIGVITLYHSKWKITLGNTINIDIKEFFSKNK